MAIQVMSPWFWCRVKQLYMTKILIKMGITYGIYSQSRGKRGKTVYMKMSRDLNTFWEDLLMDWYKIRIVIKVKPYKILVGVMEI